MSSSGWPWPDERVSARSDPQPLAPGGSGEGLRNPIATPRFGAGGDAFIGPGEADVCGGGASGSNRGFALTWWAKFETLQKLCGTEEALRLATASADAVEEIGRFCEANGVDAHYHLDGYLWAATNRAQLGSWRPLLATLDRLGVRPFQELDAEETARRSGSPVHLAGVLEATGAIVQPALLARGLRRVAVERGVRIFEGTPMTALDRSSPPTVRTPQGSITADRVVVAMNAWAIRFPEVRTSWPRSPSPTGWRRSGGRTGCRSPTRACWSTTTGPRTTGGSPSARAEARSPTARRSGRGSKVRPRAPAWWRKRSAGPTRCSPTRASAPRGPARSTGPATGSHLSAGWGPGPTCSSAWGTRATASAPPMSAGGSWPPWRSGATTNGAGAGWSGTLTTDSRRNRSGSSGEAWSAPRSPGRSASRTTDAGPGR
ncbi:MAG: FAD-dependent oxidoreductase [Actinobacteria bacterium]|nr:MAG: FAD-dependent oxidoreductase [Actinomycetota bacterium]